MYNCSLRENPNNISLIASPKIQNTMSFEDKFCILNSMIVFKFFRSCLT